MKVVIVGPGAIGCLFAALLSKVKSIKELWLLDEDPQRARRIASSGITVEGLTKMKARIPITHDARQIGESSLIIIAVKSYDMERALKDAKPLIGEETQVLTIQNGLGNLEIINEFVGQDRAIGGITAYGSTIIKDGWVRHAGVGETIIGRLDGKIFADLRSAASVLNEAGIETKMTKDIKAVIWSKLIINAGINPLAAITGLRNGDLIKYESIKALMTEVVSETVRVAKRKRIKLLYDDLLQKTESVCSATSSNICSMLQDILNKERTEIDYINAAISRQGKSLGVKTPVNDVLVGLVKAIESSYGIRVSR